MADSRKRAAGNPVLWSGLLFVAGVSLALYVAWRAQGFLAANPQLVLPTVSTTFPIIYFFSAVAVIGVVLLLIPISKLKLVLRILFVLLYGWSAFIALWLSLPLMVAISLAAVGAIGWFISPRIWLHDLLLVLAMVTIGAVFGTLLSPWPVMILLLAASVYDIVAVRFGYMMWMARKLSQAETLPAFIIPTTPAKWNLDLTASGVQKLLEGEAGEREFSILGGGDIGFPFILVVAVFSRYGLGESVIVAVFALTGLFGAYAIQHLFLKGKPMPALPPISFGGLVGLLIVVFIVG